MTQDSKSNLTGPTPSAPNSVSSLADRLKAKTAQEAAAIQSATQSELALHQQHLRDLSTNVVSSTVAAIESSVTKAAWSLEETGKAAETTIKQTTHLMKDRANQVAQHLTELQAGLESGGQTMRDSLGQASASLNEQLQGFDSTLKTTKGRFAKAANATVDAVDEQQAEVQKAVEKNTKQLVWIMRVPVALVLMFCLLVCLVAWAWLSQRVEMANERALLAEQRVQLADQKVAQREAYIKRLTQDYCATPVGKKVCTVAQK